jgi:hypothetical protein
MAKITTLPNKGLKRSYDEFNKFLDLALSVALESGTKKVPQPMHVVGYEQILDGICGFASICIKANNPLGRHIAKICREGSDTKGWAKSSETGFMFWVSYFDQSYGKKLCFANSMVNFFLEHGYPCKATAFID